MQLNFRRNSGSRTRKMAQFAVQLGLLRAAAIPAFAGPAFATAARYTCGDGVL
jgi:hypothetical protein